MGMYTELRLAVALKPNTPKEVIELLHKMCNPGHEGEIVTPKHELFSTSRWDWMLYSDSYYFDAISHSECKWDDISKQYYLTTQSNLKNYNGEIEKFLDWIKPCVETKGFAGYTRYEECEEPTLIYF